MENSSLAASRRAAQRHATAVAAGPPRSARWVAPAAAVSALAAAVALPLFRPAALALTATAVLLLAVHRGDRRNAWRYAPEPVAPARFLSPLRPVEQAPVIDLTAPAEPAQPATPVVAAVHVPTQVVPLPSIPESRMAAEDPRGGALHAPVPVTQRHRPRHNKI
jgi:predicted lysophospholipase L1 biosynthesis ABC-type transport system permease subunit